MKLEIPDSAITTAIQSAITENITNETLLDAKAAGMLCGWSEESAIKGFKRIAAGQIDSFLFGERGVRYRYADVIKLRDLHRIRK